MSSGIESKVKEQVPEEVDAKPFRSRIIRDPLHDLIRIDCKQVFDVIHTFAFQRLRKIRQLGLALLVYPGAEHSRFIHALGAYHLALQVVEALKRQDATLFDEEESVAVPLAALCHDIGHGPFSHLFERVSGEFLAEGSDHETWTRRIIEEDDQVSKILDGIGVKNKIVEIITHTYEKLYVQDIVSSQLDVDRFDYLCRDSLMTGVKYGDLDLSWLLRIIKVVDLSDKGKVLALDSRRGLSAVEAYILGRHHMYKHVYYHKTIRSAETMLKNLLKEVVKATASGMLSLKENTTHPVFVSLGEKKAPSMEDYLSINDFVIFDLMDRWAKLPAGPISDLSQRLIHRNIFATILVPDKIREDGEKLYEAIDQSRKIVEGAGLDKEIYFIYDTPQDTAYKDFYHYQRKQAEDDAQDVYCFDGEKVTPLSASGTFLSDLRYAEHRVYVPKELEEKIKPLWDAKKKKG